MSKTGYALLGLGIALWVAFFAYLVISGIRQKRRVDLDFAQLRERDKALERSLRDEIAQFRVPKTQH